MCAIFMLDINRDAELSNCPRQKMIDSNMIKHRNDVVPQLTLVICR